MTDARIDAGRRLWAPWARCVPSSARCSSVATTCSRLSTGASARPPAGSGHLLLLAGEAGIGKTRMLYAVLRKAEAAGYRLAKGDLAPHDRLVPLASILDLAARCARTRRSGRWATPAGAPGRRGCGLARIAPHPRARYRRPLISGLDRPTLLVFEDLQWADELSLEVIGELARLGRDRPLLLLGAYRLDELPAGSIHREWRARLISQRLAEEARLKPLTQDETALVVTLILGTGLPAPREVVERGVRAHGRRSLSTSRSCSPRWTTRPGRTAAPSATRTCRTRSRTRCSPASYGCRTTRARSPGRAPSSGAASCPRSWPAAWTVRSPTSTRRSRSWSSSRSCTRSTSSIAASTTSATSSSATRCTATVGASELRRLHARAAEFGAQLVGSSEIHASVHFERAGLRAQAYRTALAGARAASAVSSRREAFELYGRAVANLPDDLRPNELAALYEGYCEAAFAVDDVPLIEATADARAPALPRCRAAAGRGGHARRSWRRTRGATCVRRPTSRLLAQADAELAALPATPEREPGPVRRREMQAMLEFDAGRRRRLGAVRGGARPAPGLDDPDTGDIDYIVASVGVFEELGEDGSRDDAAGARRARAARLESTGVTAFRWAAAAAVRVMAYPSPRSGWGGPALCRRDRAVVLPPRDGRDVGATWPGRPDAGTRRSRSPRSSSSSGAAGAGRSARATCSASSRSDAAMSSGRGRSSTSRWRSARPRRRSTWSCPRRGGWPRRRWWRASPRPH